MSNLIVFEFDEESLAFEMRATLVGMQKQFLIQMADAVVVTRNLKGEVQLHQAINLTAAGAISGAFWGSLIGLIFANPLLGATMGAASGALSGRLRDIGISDTFMKELAQSFKPGTSALFVLVRKATPEKVLEGLHGFVGKARVLQTSLTADKEEQLRAFIEGTPAEVA